MSFLSSMIVKFFYNVSETIYPLTLNHKKFFSLGHLLSLPRPCNNFKKYTFPL